jgi:ABC-type lipoprotein release transport system permease subunit
MALTIVLSVSGGFQESFRDRILGLHPHMVVWPRDDHFTEYREVMAALKRDPRIEGVTPSTYDDMMLAHGDYRAGAVVKGMDPASLRSVLKVDQLMTQGSVDALNETPIVSRKGGVIHIGNLVQETSWTVLLWGDNQVWVHPNDMSVPLPDDSRLTVLNASPLLGAVDVALRESGALHAGNLVPGTASKALVVPAGLAGIVAGKQGLFDADVSLESGRSYNLILGSDGRGRLRPIDAQRPNVTEARMVLIDARKNGQPLTVQVGGTVLIPDKEVIVAARPPSILLGSVLANHLHVEIGDQITVASPFRGLGERGVAPMEMEPTSGRFQVAGIFQSGYYDYDKRFSLVSFAAALRFLNTGDRARWIEVRVDDVFKVDERRRLVQDILQPYSLGHFAAEAGVAQKRMERVLRGDVSQFNIEEPKSALGLLRNAAQLLTLLRTSVPGSFSRRMDYQVITWDEVNEPLFNALKLQKVVLSIFFLIIIVVAAFNIVGTQIMMVNQKTREIAILKAMGASRWVIRRAFLIQGLLVSLFGTLIGLALGLGACILLDRVGYPLEPEVYLIDVLPVSIDALEITLVVVATLALTFLATTFSAGRAGKLMPVKGIRYIE